MSIVTQTRQCRLQKGGRVADTINMKKRRALDWRYRAKADSRNGRRNRNDRGATLVEAAFVMPVFVLVIFGIFEFSGNIMARTGANAAVKAGARMATVQGSAPMADRAILNRMANEGAGISQDHIEQIVIWRVNGNSPSDARQKTPPAVCTNAASGFRIAISASATGGHPCNVYNDPQDTGAGAYKRAKLPLTTDTDPPASPLTSSYADYYFGCDSVNDSANVPNKLDCGWEPTTRRQIEKSPTHVGGCTGNVCNPTDVVGIYIRVRHENYTGFFGTGVTVESSTYAAIEPQGYDQ